MYRCINLTVLISALNTLLAIFNINASTLIGAFLSKGVVLQEGGNEKALEAKRMDVDYYCI